MFKKLREYRILPLADLGSVDDALHVVEALINGGLPTMELMYRTHKDHNIIKKIRQEFPDFWIGAGGILSKDLLLRVIDVKACFAISPGVSAETIQEAVKREYMLAPGVCTPSDIENSLLYGSSHFQFFPAELSGGAEMLKGLIESFEHLSIEFLPKGGITEKNICEYLQIPQVAAVSSSWIVDTATIKSKKWGNITEEAKKTKEIAEKYKT